MSNGLTPLGAAAMANHLAVAERLTALGADLLEGDASGLVSGQLSGCWFGGFVVLWGVRISEDEDGLAYTVALHEKHDER